MIRLDKGLVELRLDPQVFPQAMNEVVERVSHQITKNIGWGNHLVFTDLGPVFARMIQTFRGATAYDQAAFDRFVATSEDGGLTFDANVRVSDVSSPVSQNLPHFDGLATCYHGDYDQLAVEEATAHILWSDDRRITGSGPTIRTGCTWLRFNGAYPMNEEK